MRPSIIRFLFLEMRFTTGEAYAVSISTGEIIHTPKNDPGRKRSGADLRRYADCDSLRRVPDWRRVGTLLLHQHRVIRQIDRVAVKGFIVSQP